MPKTRPAIQPPPARDLKDACVDAAREAIAAHGVEQLSLRDVARRLGVSHQAPYRHYPSRDHLLAEVMRRCFQHFAAHLDARPRSDDPKQELGDLGRQYLSFALTHPLEYRLMFGTPWPQSAEHPDLVRDATHAFDILRKALARIHGVGLPHAGVDQDALFIWSTMHGLAGLLGGNCMQHLNVADATVQQTPEHVLEMIGMAMEARASSSEPPP
jgi:AcrR family transcriptional regulator